MTFEEMKKIVVDTLSCDEDKVTMEASLAEDLEADSLDAVELNMALEEACGVSITMRSWQTSRPWAISSTTSMPISEAEMAKRDEQYQRRNGQHGARLPAEGPAGCGCRGTTRSSWNTKSADAAPPARSGTRHSTSAPTSGVHLPIGGYYRLNLILDKGSFRELDADLARRMCCSFRLPGKAGSTDPARPA